MPLDHLHDNHERASPPRSATVLHSQIDPICATHRPSPASHAATQNGGTRAFSLISLVAQRDAGTGRWTLRAAASSCALAAWAAAADSAAAVPGMAACRVPAR